MGRNNSEIIVLLSLLLILGIDRLHPDLVNNMWINTNEIPDNNIDDDNNGYIDDVYGWNFSDDGNNNPEDVYGHGTHVAGILGAIGNNEVGVAGTMWNCKIMNSRFMNDWGWRICV